MHELDRVLDRHDVLAALDVHLVDHRGECRRFTAAGRAGDEHEAARLATELVDDVRETELLEALDLVGNGAERATDGALLQKEVAAEPRQAAHREGEVELYVLLEAVFLRLREQAVAEV